MAADNFFPLILAYTLVASAATLLAFVRQPSRGRGLVAVLSLALAAVVTANGAGQGTCSNYVEHLQQAVRGGDRRQMIALVVGAAMGLVWLALVPRRESAPAAVPASLGGIWSIAVLASALLVPLAALGIMLVHDQFPGALKAPAVEDPRFALEMIGKIDDEPIRIAVDASENVYVSYDHFKDGRECGGVQRFKFDTAAQRWQKDTVASAPVLCRPFGLTAHQGDLYVSRSGRHAVARGGAIEYLDTGAVTRLRDLDGDGFFEYFEDVVSGLPGAQGPDTQHSNNGIAFGPDGSLFVAVGSPGNRLLPKGPYEGTILRARPDFTKVEVFARGLRNPFGMTVGPEGALFVTDNDCDLNPGDEVNHIVEGGHYGHPFVVPGERVQGEGFLAPIHLGAKNENLAGMTYTEAARLPEEFRGCLYVAELAQNQVVRLKLRRVDQTYAVSQATRFLTIQHPVDVAVSPQGNFYIASRSERAIYRLIFKD